MVRGIVGGGGMGKGYGQREGWRDHMDGMISMVILTSSD